MDFMKWLNSLDELLYEVMSWLLFFPLTLWRATVRPLRTMEEVARQAEMPDEQRYSAILSPPLFLALGLLLAHAAATALGQTDAIIANRHGMAALVDDNASALVLRMVVFASYALFLAARMVRRDRQAIDRVSLRWPFYAQCYPTAVFAMALTLGTSLTQVAATSVRQAGAVLIAASVIYFVVVEVRWFAAQSIRGYLRAIGSVLLALVQGTAFLLVVGFLFTR